MKFRRLSDKLLGFLRKNRISLVILLLGALSIFIANLTYDPDTGLIEAITSYFTLIGWAILFLGFLVFFAKHKRIILANLSLLALLMILLELTCFILLDSPVKVVKNFELPDLPPDHIATALGHVPFQDSVHHDVKIVDGDTIYDVQYSIGEHGERLTPDHDSTKSKYALFFGCSIGFGHGLNDNQTLAWNFQNISSSNAYNYAFSGYGTQHMLARLEYQNLRETTPQIEQEGAAFYVFFWDHIERSIGSMARYTEWMNMAPNYEMQDGKLVRNKFFKDGRPITSWFYESIYQSSIVKYFELAFPSKLSDRHFDLVSEIVLESKKKYTDQFGNDHFYLVIYPTYENIDRKLLKLFKSYLKKKNIVCIDLNDDFQMNGSYSIHADEPHPNALANELIAAKLLERVRKIQPALYPIELR